MHPIYAAFVCPGHDPDEVAKGLRAVDPEHIRIMKVTPLKEAGSAGMITFQCPEALFDKVTEIPGIDAVNDETNYEITVQFPTPAMDELFTLSVANFLKDKPSHLRVMADSCIQATPTIERWSRGRNLPGLVVRVHIMDWIWNHYCNCKCT